MITVTQLAVVALLTTITTTAVNGVSNCCTDCIQCPSSDRCIKLSQVCDGTDHCDHGEEEDPTWCQNFKDSSCTIGQKYCPNYGCMAWQTACSHHYCSHVHNIEPCLSITRQLLPSSLKVEKQTGNTVTSMEALATYLTTANCSLQGPTGSNRTSCPMLYTPLASTCLAVLPFQVSWPDAREACRSISGELLEFEFVDFYAELVQHFIKSDFTSDYWIGGFFDIKKDVWAWSSGSKMPKSTPYWFLKHDMTCSPRQTTSLGSTPLCSNYRQAPLKQEAGYCAALQAEYMYYLSDEGCFDKKQPLCTFDLPLAAK